LRRALQERALAPHENSHRARARFAQVTLEKMSTSSDSDSDVTTRTRTTSLSPDTKSHQSSHLHRPIDKKAKAGKVVCARAMPRIVAATTAAPAPVTALSMISAAAVISAKPTAPTTPGVEPMLLSAQPTALVDDNFMSSEIELHLIREELAEAHRDLERTRRRMYHEAEARRAVEQAKHAFAALAPPPPPPLEAAPPAVSHAVPCGGAPNATARESFALFDPAHAAAHAASVAAASVAAASAAAAAAQFEAEQRQRLAAAHAASIAAASIAAASASVAAAQFEAEHSRKKKVDAANILSTLFACG